MHTNPGSFYTYPDGLYTPPRKYALVISCVDYRLLDDTVRFLNHDNLTNRYYHSTFAGASIALVANPPQYFLCAGGCKEPHDDRKNLDRCRDRQKDPMNFACWRSAAIDQLKLTLKLTGGKLSDIYLLEHRDCGAYREFLYRDVYQEYLDNPAADPERAEHLKWAKQLADELCVWFCENEHSLKEELCLAEVQPPRILGFLMGLRGDVELLFEQICECKETTAEPAPPPREKTPSKPKAGKSKKQ